MNPSPASRTGLEPIRSLVLKVVSGCNLDCDYCYEYRYGDDSWKRKPPTISDETVQLLARRIREHAWAHSMRDFAVSLHGGEPMLVGAARLCEIAGALRRGVGEVVTLHFGMQTNGTLLDDEAVGLLAGAGISIGVSLDGDAVANDRHRIDRQGRGSHARALEGIRAIRRVAPEWFGGILCVVNVEADPAAVFRFLAELEPPLLDFLLPHGNWDRMPPHKTDALDLRYGRWLVTAFDEWFDGRHRSVSVRYFESILATMLGGASSTEAIGPGPVTLVTIGTDGAYEGVDTMKSVFPGAQRLGLGLRLARLDDVVATEHLKLRQARLDELCGECRSCPIRGVCGGGYFPHRYGRGRDFANPSVYCEDIRLLVEHVRARVLATVRGGTA